MSENEEMRVWVGCLGCYNAGHLIGEWFDAIDAPTEITEFNGAIAPHIFASAPTEHRDHEELWVFDHEGFGGLLKGECSPMEAQRIAELVADVHDPDAFKAFMEYEGGNVDQAAIERFDEAFCGFWEHEADFAQELAEDVGDSIPLRWPFSCIDWDKAWRELEMGGDNFSVPVNAPDGSQGHGGYGYYIFRSI